MTKSHLFFKMLMINNAKITAMGDSLVYEDSLITHMFPPDVDMDKLADEIIYWRGKTLDDIK